MTKEKLITFLLHKIEHGLIFSHEFDWYCYEDGPFPLFKGDLPGSGFDDVLVVGPYKTQLLAYSAYKRAIGVSCSCVSRRVCRNGEFIYD